MYTHKRREIIDLLARYLENRCSAAELEQVKQILQTKGYEKEWETALSELKNSITNDQEPELPIPRSTELYNRITNTLDERKKRIFPGFRRHWGWMAAASVVLILVGSLWLSRPVNNSTSASLSVTVTAATQRKAITLADGTKIWMNSSSQLRYPAAFTGKNRDVYLEGEAFFDVAHNPDRPFRIHLSGLTVQVYGTSFNIRSYENDQDIAVAVATGKVGVTKSDQVANQGEMLLPGNLLTYYRKDGHFEKEQIATTDVYAWNEGWMIFKEETLENICHVLERRYGVTIHLEKETLRTRKVTLKQRNESLENVLAVMQLTSSIHYRRQGNEIWIR